MQDHYNKNHSGKFNSRQQDIKDSAVDYTPKKEIDADVESDDSDDSQGE